MIVKCRNISTCEQATEGSREKERTREFLCSHASLLNANYTTFSHLLHFDGQASASESDCVCVCVCVLNPLAKWNCWVNAAKSAPIPIDICYGRKSLMHVVPLNDSFHSFYACLSLCLSAFVCVCARAREEIFFKYCRLFRCDATTSSAQCTCIYSYSARDNHLSGCNEKSNVFNELKSYSLLIQPEQI